MIHRTGALLSALLACAACGGRSGLNPETNQGRRLYQVHGCAVCHGEEGHGDGPVGLTLEPRPRDFRDIAAFKQGSSVAAIANTIALGVHEKGSQMQPYAHIPEADRVRIAMWIHSLEATPASTNPAVAAAPRTPPAAPPISPTPQSPSESRSTKAAIVGPSTALRVLDGWAREASKGRSTAVYLTLENTSARDLTIVGVECPLAPAVDIHRAAVRGDGVMEMPPMPSLTIPPHGQVRLDEGGSHLMLIGLRQDLDPGVSLRLVLILSDGARVEVDCPVRALGFSPG